MKKNTDFIGRAVAEAERDNPPIRQLLVFEVDALGPDVEAYKAVFINNEVQGFCTSGGHSHHVDKSIAFALVPRSCVTDHLAAKIEILGQRREAKILLEPLL